MDKRPYLIAHNGARIFGGAERWTVNMLAGLQQRGHRVKLLCNDAVVAERATRRGIDVQIAELRGDVVLTDALRFAQVLRRERPDVLLFTTFKKIWLGGIAARLARVPYTIARVGLSSDSARSLKYRIALHAIDEIIVNAPDMAGLFEGPVRVIPNGVAVPAVTQSAGDFRRSVGVPADAFVIGTVARVTQHKRHDKLIEVVSMLPGHVHAVIAGTKSWLLDGLLAQAAQLGVQDRVHFIGNREDVGNVLNALDVFVLCSEREGMSNATLEAMAAGRPIVSTPVSGAAFALNAENGNARAGIMTRTHDVAEIAAAVKQLVDSPELRAELAARAQRRHQEQFDSKQMIAAYEAALFHTQEKSCANS